MVLAEQGFRLLKFFPADAAGGLAWLKAVARAAGRPALLPDRRHRRRHRPGLPVARQRRLRRRLLGGAARTRWPPATGTRSSGWPPQPRTQTALASRPERCFKVIRGVRPAFMNKLAIAATALVLAAGGAARADLGLVLNSEEASYSILSRSGRVELTRLPVGREPHHLIADARRQGSAGRLDGDQRAAGARRQDRRAAPRRARHHRSLPAGLQPGRQVVRHRRLPARPRRHLPRRRLQARRPHLHRRPAEPHGVRRRVQDGVRDPAADRPRGRLRPRRRRRSSGTSRSARRRPASSCCPTTSACSWR